MNQNPASRAHHGRDLIIAGLPRRITTRCSSRSQQDFRRFAGWTLVLGGLAYALTWLIAPIEIANPLSGTFLGAAVLLVVSRRRSDRRWEETA